MFECKKTGPAPVGVGSSVLMDYMDEVLRRSHRSSDSNTGAAVRRAAARKPVRSRVPPVDTAVAASTSSVEHREPPICRREFRMAMPWEASSRGRPLTA